MTETISGAELAKTTGSEQASQSIVSKQPAMVQETTTWIGIQADNNFVNIIKKDKKTYFI